MDTQPDKGLTHPGKELLFGSGSGAPVIRPLGPLDHFVSWREWVQSSSTSFIFADIIQTKTSLLREHTEANLVNAAGAALNQWRIKC
jgi:hypothetical protein